MHNKMTVPGALKREGPVDVAIVDDDPNSCEQVTSILNGDGSCFRCATFETPEMFYNISLKSFDLMVFDEYYQETHTRRAAELVQYSLEHYPKVPIIVFSAYPDPMSIARSEEVTAFVDKVRTNQDPSILRTQVGRALRDSGRLSDELLDRVMHHLQEKDALEKREVEEYISDITMGNVIYQFCTPLAVVSEWTINMNSCTFSLKAYPGFLVGDGPDRGSARAAFYGQFHEKFQEIFTKSALYDSEQDKADRCKLLEIVNMDKYNSLRTIFVPNWYGQIRQISEDGIRTITWWEGPTTTHRLDEVPSLANLKKGDWVRAAIEKRVATGSVVRVLNAAWTSTPTYSHERREAFWNSKTLTHES
jgi:DNA-binding NarL/FixJ family response regulator